MQHDDFGTDLGDDLPDDDINDAINMSLAWETIQYVKKVLPRGSVNKKIDEEKADHPDLILKFAEMRKYADSEAQLRLEERLETALKLGLTHTELLHQCLAEIYKEYKIGNCIEQAIVGLDYLREKGVPADLYYMEGGDHYFIRIGNVVCDPWAESSFLFKDFEQHQKDSINLEFADFVYEQKGREEVKPYLFGTPKIFGAGAGLQSIHSASSNVRIDSKNESIDTDSEFGKGNTLFGQKASREENRFNKKEDELTTAYQSNPQNYYSIIEDDKGFYEVAFIANQDLKDDHPLIKKIPLNTSDFNAAADRVLNYLKFQGVNNPVAISKGLRQEEKPNNKPPR